MTFRIDDIPATAQEDKGFLIHHFASVALALTSMVISSGGNTFMAGAPGSVNMRTAIRLWAFSRSSRAHIAHVHLVHLEYFGARYGARSWEVPKDPPRPAEHSELVGSHAQARAFHAYMPTAPYDARAHVAGAMALEVGSNIQSVRTLRLGGYDWRYSSLGVMTFRCSPCLAWVAVRA